jgi:diaminohydroxyphosphoribosylaminopyrimidine deaminase/5-amino-6-(5-phosphoribosylamino)uracil reductase
VESSRQPLRIVVDRHLQIPLDAQVLDDANALIIAADVVQEKVRRLEDKGIAVVRLPNPDNKVDLPAMMRELARRELNEILVESGSRLHGALIRARVVDELLLYFAPHLLGDTARGMFDLGELTSLDQRFDLTIRDLRRIGPDLRLIARLRRDS